MSDNLTEGMSAVQLDELDVNEDPLANWIQKSELIDSEKQTLMHDLLSAMQECRSQAGEDVPWSKLHHLRGLILYMVGRASKEIDKMAWMDETLLAWMKLLLEHRLIECWYSGLVYKTPVRVKSTPSGTMLQLMHTPRALSRGKSPFLRDHSCYGGRIKVVADFKRKFAGNGMRYLEDHLVRLGQNYNPARHAARIVPIIQSDGSGKSRTTIELAQAHLGLFVCVRREPGELRTVLEPPRDRCVAEWLTPTDPNSGYNGKPTEGFWATHASTTETNKIAIWLASFALELALFYRILWIRWYGKTWPTSSDVDVEEWNEFKSEVGWLLHPLGDHRYRLLNDIDKRASSRLLKLPLEKRDSGTSGRLIAELQTSWQALESMLPTPKDFVHLTIDEFGPMTKNLSALQSVLSKIKFKKSWILIVDTDPSVIREIYQNLKIVSIPYHRRTLVPMEPFTFLPLDVGLSKVRDEFRKICLGKPIESAGQDGTLAQSKTDLKHISLSRYLRLMGRPMLQDDWLLGSKPEEWPWSAGVDLHVVRRKLMFNSKNGWALFDVESFTLVTQRFPLRLAGFPGTYEAQNLPEQLVGVHLRRLDQVLPMDRGIRTCVPSEPLISLAATFVFRQDAAGTWARIIACIDEFMKAQKIVLGETGEEYVQMLLTAALDTASPNSFDSKGPAPLSVRDWLKALIQPSIHIGSEGTPKVFQEILTWADGYSVNFSHFVRLDAVCTQQRPLDHCSLVQAWLRQAALIAAPGQSGWDLLIPTYRSYDKDADFHPRHVSYLGIQLRSRNGFATGWKGEFATHVQDFEANTEHARLSLWIDLDNANKLEAVCEPYSPNTQDQKDFFCAQPKRYNLKIEGRGALTYKVIQTMFEAHHDKTKTSEDPLGAWLPSMKGLGSGINSPDKELLDDQKTCQGRFVPWSDSH